MKITCDKNNPPLSGLITAEYLKTAHKIELTWGTSTLLETDTGPTLNCTTPNDLSRFLARLLAEKELYGLCPLEKTEADHWLSYSIGPLSNKYEFAKAVAYLNNILGPITYLVGKRLTISDFSVFSALYVSKEWKVLAKNDHAHVQRWFDLISSVPAVVNVLSNLPEEIKSALTSAISSVRQSLDKSSKLSLDKSVTGQRNQEGKFVELPGAEMGKVVVRFPPEASGYLHIGHAKAALLNQYYQQAFEGKLIMRFDDTNPAKENVHFEQVILEDLEMLEIKPDLFTHTSNYFDLMLEYCERLLTDEKAYVDDTEPEQMKLQREQKVECANRTQSVDKNLAMWEEMKKGTVKGQKCCVRAKIDMQSSNGCMRDPTIYRCKNEIHPRTGDKYKVYPTYDFACPIVDAIENVTHTLRTMEYHDRDAQFYWFIEALNLRRPVIWEYSRLSMTNTVLSKRKLTWFVQERLVDGWDDPRFPTVRGVLRRGMTVEGLKQFIIAQGSSRCVVFMEWDKIWAFNKKVIDPIAPRYTAVDFYSPVPVLVKDVSLEKLSVPKHTKNAEVGDKDVYIGPRILIDYADAKQLKENENTTFINWGNLLIKKINIENGVIVSVEAEPNIENKDYKKTLKLTWLCETDKAPFTPCFCVYFEHIINKAVLAKDEDFKQYIGHETRLEVQVLGDPELKTLKRGDIIQIQRKGFFKVDVAYKPANDTCFKANPVILFSIPDGHSKESPFATAAKITKTTSNRPTSTIVSELAKLESIINCSKNKTEIDTATKSATALKAEFTKVTGLDWDDERIRCPVEGLTIQSTVDAPPVESLIIANITAEKIAAEKDPQIKEVLEKVLEAQERWRLSSSGSVVPEVECVGNKVDSSGQEDILFSKIAAQGEKIRELKAKKADKASVESGVKILLALKVEYKTLTGKDWKPQPAGAINLNNETELLNKIIAQGDVVRDLKTKEADKLTIEAAVKVLLALKTEHKVVTGKTWKPITATAMPSIGTVSEADLLNKINAQGNSVRDLKAKKAGKSAIDCAVKTLLALKGEYKSLTGKDWTPVVQKPVVETSGGGESALLNKITVQGDKIRDLKTQKAEKTVIEAEVKTLLGLKAEYKTLTGKDWKSGTTVISTSPPISQQTGTETNAETIVLSKIAEQGETVRTLKGDKADKAAIDAAVKLLINYKADYKILTGKDWKPGTTVTSASTPITQQADTETNAETIVLSKIAEQGETVRKLKGDKADKAAIDTAVKLLLNYKANYKGLTGKDWKPRQQPSQVMVDSSEKSDGDTAKDSLTARITEQGNLVRSLKTSGGARTDIEVAVKTLLDLKIEYKTLTGTDFPVAGRAPSKPKEAKPANKKAPAKEKKLVNASEDGGPKKQTRLGLEAKKEENLSDWYSQVITKGEMIEYYDVSGCYIYRPWSYAIWELIKDWFDGEIKKLGVQNCYFPIFVSRSVLEKEKNHIANFAPEVAWVTKSGDSDMAEPIAVRPTSETVMYPAYAKWIQSYRDLPIKLNQWNNVVRWEFKHPQPFLRTREFLWQEGHTAYATPEEATTEVSTILDLYARIYTDLLAIPVIKGRKTEKEKFAGGDYTLTVEAYVSASGRAIQGATSHHLGQNFSRMFDITFEDPETREKKHVFQNSWGITTRTIGVMIMIHADNQGLVLPPQVASVQIVIVPCGITATLSDSDAAALQKTCDGLEEDIKKEGIRVKGDYRNNYSPGWKFNHWELKGVPIRVELGPKDMKNSQLVAVRRDTGEKITIKRNNAAKELATLLQTIQKNLYDKASEDINKHTVILKDWSQFSANLDNKNIILAPFCGDIICEDKIKADSARDDVEAEPGAPAMGAKSLCIPLEQPANINPVDKCIHPSCKNKPKFYTLFGRSY